MYNVFEEDEEHGITITRVDTPDVAYNVNQNGVTLIEQKPAYGDGDKWYYVIWFGDKKYTKVFNPVYVNFEVHKD